MTDKTAILNIPVMPYKIPMAVKKIVEANMFSVTYLIAPSICIFFPPIVNTTKEEIITISNQTYKLKISPVKKAPKSPIIRKWNKKKYPYFILDGFRAAVE